jgi:uracil-DNA glycosylase family 4
MSSPGEAGGPGGPVPPGSGWPGDVATPATPVAHTAAEVETLSGSAPGLTELVARQSVCRACPRLVTWREEVAAVRRRSFQTERYWGRPIPGWGAEAPKVLIVGLAPAAHGGNRTGRIFTGDRSGDFLFASLYRCGLADSPVSARAGDGQRMREARMMAAVRCAPPANKPTPGERDTCAPWLVAEIRQVSHSARVIVCLGGFAWQAVWPVLRAAGFALPPRRPPFGHGAEIELRRHGSAQSARQPAAQPGAQAAAGSGAQAAAGSGAQAAAGSGAQAAAGSGAQAAGRPVLLLGCYHPSQQNTFTGRVTPDMLDTVFRRAANYAGVRGVCGGSSDGVASP